MSQHGQEVVIVEAVRTAIGRGHPEKGYYRDVHPATLLAHTYGALLARSGVEASAVENAIAGCASGPERDSGQGILGRHHRRRGPRLDPHLPRGRAHLPHAGVPRSPG